MKILKLEWKASHRGRNSDTIEGRIFFTLCRKRKSFFLLVQLLTLSLHPLLLSVYLFCLSHLHLLPSCTHSSLSESPFSLLNSSKKKRKEKKRKKLFRFPVRVLVEWSPFRLMAFYIPNGEFSARDSQPSHYSNWVRISPWIQKRLLMPKQESISTRFGF